MMLPLRFFVACDHIRLSNPQPGDSMLGLAGFFMLMGCAVIRITNPTLTERLTVRLTQDLRTAIEREADAWDVSMGAVAREALRGYMKDAPRGERGAIAHVTQTGRA